MKEEALQFIKKGALRVKSFFLPTERHFSFITAHYIWIVSATIIASIAIFAGGSGNVAYIDALLFASGANTQAGLNPVNVNDINTFQQIVIYLFAMLSCPITLHGSVVMLRLYWFEKRFQSLVKEAKSRRRTLTKSRSQARGDIEAPAQGVNGRHITLVPPTGGRSKKMTNDGIVLDQDQNEINSHPVVPPSEEIKQSDASDTTAATSDGPSSSPRSDAPELHGHEHANGITPQQDHADDGSHTFEHTLSGGPFSIKFADTVKRSDGVDDDLTKFPQRRPDSEHIAILERQRNQDNEVLHIPGPRDIERGLGPRRLDSDDEEDDEDGQATIARTATYESQIPNTAQDDPARGRNRQPTITIAEPERRRRDEMADEVKVWGNTLDTLRFRKPRIFNSGQKQVHEDASKEKKKLPLRTFGTIRSALSRDKDDDMPYLSYTPTIGRNSNFIGLSLEEREELGGIEYRSLRTLLLVLFVYFWGFQIFGLVFLLPFIKENSFYGNLIANENINRTWWGFFTPNSAFMDLGFTLTPDSMNSFYRSAFVLMIMWFLILIGNTGFPVMLRFVIWVTSLIVPKGAGIWEELRFLLDHPRRCFTLLFPSGANWWLFWILVILNAIDLFFFIILDLGSGPVSRMPVHVRVIDGLFQAASVRTAGFSCINLTSLHPAVPVLYIIMMYISVFPIAISIRRTNVYEEKSLGVYHDRREDEDELGGHDTGALSYVGTHLRRQLSFDLWFVFLGYFILAISEGPKIQDGTFNMFSVLFEIVSAYGTVGLSMGATNSDASLCSQFSVVGKLVIVAMEIRGRHRGLPYGLDRAVLLPSESRFKKETEDLQPTLVRSNTTAQSHAVSTGLQRPGSQVGLGQSLSRGRTRSLSRDRGDLVNSNLITQFLHPGPSVSYDAMRAHRRSRSVDIPDDILSPKRSKTQPPEDEDPELLAPMPTLSARTVSRRTASFSNNA